MGSAATSSNLKPFGTRILERESSGEKVVDRGSGSIVISERSSAYAFKDKNKIASANKTQLNELQ
jgi:hypothetical protein